MKKILVALMALTVSAVMFAGCKAEVTDSGIDLTTTVTTTKDTTAETTMDTTMAEGTDATT